MAASFTPFGLASNERWAGACRIESGWRRGRFDVCSSFRIGHELVDRYGLDVEDLPVVLGKHVLDLVQELQRAGGLDCLDQHRPDRMLRNQTKELIARRSMSAGDSLECLYRHSADQQLTIACTFTAAVVARHREGLKCGAHEEVVVPEQYLSDTGRQVIYTMDAASVRLAFAAPGAMTTTCT